MPTPHRPTLAVRRALQKLGLDIRDARRHRGLPAEIVAGRAFTSRPTLRRVEAGHHGVSISVYAAVLHALGLLDGVAMWADPATDKVGTAMASARLPKRTRLKRRPETGDGG